VEMRWSYPFHREIYCSPSIRVIQDIGPGSWTKTREPQDLVGGSETLFCFRYTMVSTRADPNPPFCIVRALAIHSPSEIGLLTSKSSGHLDCQMKRHKFR